MGTFMKAYRLAFLAILTLTLIYTVTLSFTHKSQAQASATPPEDIIARPQLYTQGEFIVRYQADKSPADVQAQVDRRAQLAQTVLGRIRKTSEDISLSLRGEEKPEDTLSSIEAVEKEFNVLVAEPTAQKSDTYAYSFQAVDSPEDVQRVIDAYSELPIEYIQPNYNYYLNSIPNDPDYPKQWGLPMIEAPQMWDIQTSSSSIKVGIIDSGIDRNHPDLAQNVVKSVPIASGCINDGDANGHGTHVAGIIGATANNFQGIAGVTWDVDIYGYCVMSPNGTGSSLTIAQGINRAVEDGVDVINMSFGGPIMVGTDHEVEDAINNALSKNIAIVVSAGNCGNIPPGQHPDNPTCFWGSDADKYSPGNHPDTISVTALGPQSEHPLYANTGRTIDVSAPGGNPPGGSSTCNPGGTDCIYSTWDRFKSCPVTGALQGYCPISGTSMAAPHVTAIVALMKSIDRTLKPREVLNIINSSAHDLGTNEHDPIFGYGRVSAFKAIQITRDRRTTPTPSGTVTPTSTTGTPTPSVTPTCQDARMRGDYNCDGFINLVDFELWRQDFVVGKATLVEFEWFRAGFTTATF